MPTEKETGAAAPEPAAKSRKVKRVQPSEAALTPQVQPSEAAPKEVSGEIVDPPENLWQGRVIDAALTVVGAVATAVTAYAAGEAAFNRQQKKVAG
jgi:hypothetical protein